VNRRVARAMAQHGQREPLGDERPDFFGILLNVLLGGARWWW